MPVYILVLVLITPQNTTTNVVDKEFFSGDSKARCEATAKEWEKKMGTKLSTGVGICLLR